MLLTMIIAVTNEDVELALSSSPWDLGNAVLYNLCKEHPIHESDEAIIAKIWLIGRTYAAAIERRRNAQEQMTSDDFYITTVAKTIRESKIDKWLTDIPAIITNSWIQLESAIATHKKLMDLFAEISGLEKRALASKYLHFHRPDVFFIYDSRARQAINKVTPSIIQIPEIKCKVSDAEYLFLVRKCLWLEDDIAKRYGVVLTPRQIDKILLIVADRIKKSGRQRTLRMS